MIWLYLQVILEWNKKYKNKDLQQANLLKRLNPSLPDVSYYQIFNIAGIFD